MRSTRWISLSDDDDERGPTVQEPAGVGQPPPQAAASHVSDHPPHAQEPKPLPQGHESEEVSNHPPHAHETTIDAAASQAAAPEVQESGPGKLVEIQGMGAEVEEDEEMEIEVEEDDEDDEDVGHDPSAAGEDAHKAPSSKPAPLPPGWTCERKCWASGSSSSTYHGPSGEKTRAQAMMWSLYYQNNPSARAHLRHSSRASLPVKWEAPEVGEVVSVEVTDSYSRHGSPDWRMARVVCHDTSQDGARFLVCVYTPSERRARSRLPRVV